MYATGRLDFRHSFGFGFSPRVSSGAASAGSFPDRTAAAGNQALQQAYGHKR